MDNGEAIGTSARARDREPGELFIDLEIGLVDGPAFVDQPYRIGREIVGLSYPGYPRPS